MAMMSYFPSKTVPSANCDTWAFDSGFKYIVAPYQVFTNFKDKIGLFKEN